MLVEFIFSVPDFLSSKARQQEWLIALPWVLSLPVSPISAPFTTHNSTHNVRVFPLLAIQRKCQLAPVTFQSITFKDSVAVSSCKPQKRHISSPLWIPTNRKYFLSIRSDLQITFRIKGFPSETSLPVSPF